MTSEKVLKELIKTRKELRKKIRSIKTGETDTLNQLEETFKPITQPLKHFINEAEKYKLKPYNKKNVKANAFTSNKRLRDDDDDANDDKEYDDMFNKSLIKKESSTPQKRRENIERTYTNKLAEKDESNDEFFSQTDFSQATDDDDDDVYNDNYGTSIMNLTDLARKNKLDTTYGAHKNKYSGEWMFGNSTVKLTDDKIKIGNENWALTPGLFELMFTIKPQNYDKTDLDVYKNILLKTSAYRRNYKPDGQRKGSRGYKYKKIISKLLNDNKSKALSSKSTSISERKGSGMMKLNPYKTNYLYWDDPNELVDRLRLLVASQAAGHTNHNNEIVSIIEELREANIIV